eukprot:TRINITY_DN28274_c0_g1_i3.p1 TRINITY_DN28274_c0_g1~~TRINITY_DN28274_c0_g1_i3.p1  ORF type:complete len:155 (+),score=23.96 TRINITY_DN28274_c0_g1_i3:62-466(+)
MQLVPAATRGPAPTRAPRGAAPGLRVRGMRNEAQLLRDQWLTAPGNAAAEDLVAHYLIGELAAEEGGERHAALDSLQGPGLAWVYFARAAQWAQFRTRKQAPAERRGRLASRRQRRAHGTPPSPPPSAAPVGGC